jgi:hypothetical protein
MPKPRRSDSKALISFITPALQRAQVVGLSVLLRHGYGAYDCEQHSE